MAISAMDIKGDSFGNLIRIAINGIAMASEAANIPMIANNAPPINPGDMLVPNSIYANVPKNRNIVFLLCAVAAAS